MTTYNCVVSGAKNFKIGMFHEGHVVEINVGVIKTGLIILVCYQGMIRVASRVRVYMVGLKNYVPITTWNNSAKCKPIAE